MDDHPEISLTVTSENARLVTSEIMHSLDELHQAVAQSGMDMQDPLVSYLVIAAMRAQLDTALEIASQSPALHSGSAITVRRPPHAFPPATDTGLDELHALTAEVLVSLPALYGTSLASEAETYIASQTAPGEPPEDGPSSPLPQT